MRLWSLISKIRVTQHSSGKRLEKDCFLPVTTTTLSYSKTQELVAAVGIYMDALPYSQVDSVLGVWAINLVTGARHVMMLLRKRMACACGCRGWCTYHGILHFIHWVIQCLASGINPLQRHDGSSFESSFHDELRSQAAGAVLTFKTAVLKLKGDWQEFAERLWVP